MKSNIVTIEFKKKDGTTRITKASLIPAMIPARKTPLNKSRKRAIQPTYKIAYFDVEAGHFKSFLAQNFIKINKIESLLSIVQNSISIAA